MNPKISILVLAAGASTRMKTIKQLLPWQEKTLLEHVINTAVDSKAETVYTVLGAHSDLILEKLSVSNVNTVVNNDWESGMGSSIAVGVEEILKTEKPEGIIVLLGDQPLIDSAYIDELIHVFVRSKKDIIGTTYPTKTGVPAVFGRPCFPDLLDLKGREGAWTLISKYGENVIALDAGDKVRDLDTREDFDKVK